MIAAKKLLTGLSVLVLVGFGLLLLLSLLVPIYTDEIGSKAQLMRSLVEGGRLVTLLPQCKSEWSQPIPLSWYPAAAYYHVFFLPLGLLGHKLAAIGLAFGWFAAVACALRRTTRDLGAILRGLASFVAFHAAGTLPFGIVTGRAEPTTAILLGAFIAFPLAWPIESRRTGWGRMVVAGGFVLTTSILFYSSAKSLYFTPLVLLSAVFTFRRRVRWLVPMVAVVGLTALQTHACVKRFISCEEAPMVQAVLRSIPLDPGRLLRQPMSFLSEGAKNLTGHSVDIADGLMIGTQRPWLPPVTAQNVPAAVVHADTASRGLLYAAMIGVPGLVVIVLVRAWRRPGARVPLALAATLLACVAGHVFLAHHWAFYMSPLVLCLLALVGVVAVSAMPTHDRDRLKSLVMVGSFALQAVALAVIITTLAHVGPHLFALARVEGTVLPGQPAWVPALGFSKERPKIRAQAGRCGIHGDGARRLVIDDATFFAFDDLREPLHLVYVTDTTMWGHDIQGEKNVALLRELDASGIISRCNFLPTALESKAKRADGYCCVSAEDLR